jgi:hypothetical protein
MHGQCAVRPRLALTCPAVSADADADFGRWNPGAAHCTISPPSAPPVLSSAAIWWIQPGDLGDACEGDRDEDGVAWLSTAVGVKDGRWKNKGGQLRVVTSGSGFDKNLLREMRPCSAELACCGLDSALASIVSRPHAMQLGQQTTRAPSRAVASTKIWGKALRR